MTRNPRPRLSREVLSDLAAAELLVVTGGGTTGVETLSCYTFVSCNPLDCVTRWPTVLLDCVLPNTIHC